MVIHLTANQDCWVLLTKRSDGSQIYLGVVPAGSSMTWTENQAMDVRLGNPPGVVLTVNGVRLPGKAVPARIADLLPRFARPVQAAEWMPGSR